MNKYDDIINREYHKNKDRNNMSLEHRSFQFAPFSALNGFDEEIKNLESSYVDRNYFQNELEETLNRKIIYLQNHLASKPKIRVIYFNSLKLTPSIYDGQVKRVDEVNKKIIFLDNYKISIDDILELNGDLFNDINSYF